MKTIVIFFLGFLTARITNAQTTWDTRQISIKAYLIDTPYYVNSSGPCGLLLDIKNNGDKDFYMHYLLSTYHNDSSLLEFKLYKYINGKYKIIKGPHRNTPEKAIVSSHQTENININIPGFFILTTGTYKVELYYNTHYNKTHKLTKYKKDFFFRAIK